ncbi:MAG TPA: SigB/SigF/SigG family RNA polymerase sigma factor [Pseudonocardia sp.]|jgi:RNA polymerase sigma-B factor|nr:SigB/SigF/SigG family RNA polymerase sigma factor [Pseudonocardia sp.]
MQATRTLPSDTCASPRPAAVEPARNAEYAHLEPLLAEFAGLEPTDPRRHELRDQLVQGYLPVAEHIALRFAHRGEPLDDLTQVASLGLLFAVDRFRPEFGRDFLAFAIPTIQGEVRRHFRDRSWSMRVPRRLKDLHVSINAAVAELSQRLNHSPRPSEIANLLGISVEEVLEGLEASYAYRASSLDKELSPRSDGGTNLGEQLGALDPGMEFVEDQHTLQPLLNELPERERTILMLRFYGNLSQTQIAARMNISQMHVSRLLAKTLGRLRDQMHNQP